MPNQLHLSSVFCDSFCNFIPPHLVPKLARETGVDFMARSFSAWSHVVSMLFGQNCPTPSVLTTSVTRCGSTAGRFRACAGRLLRAAIIFPTPISAATRRWLNGCSGPRQFEIRYDSDETVFACAFATDVPARGDGHAISSERQHAFE